MERNVQAGMQKNVIQHYGCLMLPQEAGVK